MAQRPDQSVFHLGPQRDISIFEGLNVRFAGVEEADYVVCTGLFNDDVETAESYRDMLGVMRRRELFMLCANPDVVVDRGDRLVYCAGAIADLYGSLGGEVLYAGKPYRPIYEMALAKAEKARGEKAPLSRVLAIGDSVRTDLKGAATLRHRLSVRHRRHSRGRARRPGRPGRRSGWRGFLRRPGSRRVR